MSASPRRRTLRSPSQKERRPGRGAFVIITAIRGQDFCDREELFSEELDEPEAPAEPVPGADPDSADEPDAPFV